jgi:hypothetical protein
MQFQVNGGTQIRLLTKVESMCNGRQDTFLNTWYKITFKAI